MPARAASSRFVRERDHGYDALLRRVFKLGHPQVVMGILEKDGAKTHKTESPGAEPVSIIDVAGWFEFGFTVKLKDGSEREVPARSFIRAWWDEASPKLRRDLVVLMQSVVKGTRTKAQILELLGLEGQAGIQKFLADGKVTPDITEETKRRKGSSKPGIETGQMRSAVSYEVREK